MTRETKIGLLVGLAFIVVFAMLLSHSGPSAAPGDVRQLTRARQLPPPALINEPVIDTSTSPIASFPEEPDSATFNDTLPNSGNLEPRAPDHSDSPEVLPRPTLLNPAEPSDTEQPPVGIVEADERGRLEILRVAPSPNEPITAEPGSRVNEPTRTPDPLAPTEAKPLEHAPEGPSIETKTAAATTPRRAKEHIVQKGENVNAILQREYGSASPRIAEAFLQANKDQIKNIDLVIEGQKLVIPALPADMFEFVDGGKVVLNAAAAGPSDATLAKLGGIIDEPRRAPGEVSRLANAAGDREKRNSKDAENPPADAPRTIREPRVYEVQSKDTLSSIAREFLGTEARWKEIQRLNPKVDPAKMRPGTKLKLPNKRPLSNAVEAGST